MAALFSFTAQACGASHSSQITRHLPSRSHPRPGDTGDGFREWIEQLSPNVRVPPLPPHKHRPITPASSHNCVAAAAPPSKSRHRCRVPFGHTSTVRSCAFPQCNNVTIWLQVHACRRPAGGVTQHAAARARISVLTVCIADERVARPQGT